MKWPKQLPTVGPWAFEPTDTLHIGTGAKRSLCGMGPSHDNHVLARSSENTKARVHGERKRQQNFRLPWRNHRVHNKGLFPELSFLY